MNDALSTSLVNAYLAHEQHLLFFWLATSSRRASSARRSSVPWLPFPRGERAGVRGDTP